MAAVGVMVAVFVKVAVLVALNVSAVPLTVRLPPKLIASLARDVNVPADLENPPLKLIVPAAVVF